MSKNQERRISDAHLQAIGSIVGNFAYLEAIIKLVIWMYSGLERQRTGQIFTSKLPFRALLEVLEAIIRETGATEDSIAYMKRLINRADRINKRRNEIIHSTWAVGDDPSVITRAKVELREGYQFKAEELTARQLNEISNRMSALAKEFIDFSWSLYP